jgi:hypothetical protein
MGGLPRPGRVLKVVMIAVLAIWLAFAIGINWAGAPETVFLLFCGNTERILSGEVFRLFTAPWMHMPSGTIGHVLSTLFGLYAGRSSARTPRTPRNTSGSGPPTAARSAPRETP